jgi:hypothetical protein
MALVEELLTEEAVVGTGLGTGALFLGLPLLGRILRPTAKAFIKGGIVLYRETADVLSEAMVAPTATAPASPALETARREPGAMAAPTATAPASPALETRRREPEAVAAPTATAPALETTRRAEVSPTAAGSTPGAATRGRRGPRPRKRPSS